MQRFVTGLRRDHAAVLNGLTLTYSSGAVEGNVNGIKMIKRQMWRCQFRPVAQAHPAPHDTARPPNYGEWARSSFGCR